MRQEVVRLLKPLAAIAVENPVLPGTPDVNYVEGWIELKWIRSWPKQAETVVKIDHYTAQQRIWHYKRRRAGGQSWFLLRCRTEWLLMDGAVAAFTVNRATKAELIAACTAYWGAGLSATELLYYLKQRLPAYSFTPEEISRLRDL